MVEIIINDDDKGLVQGVINPATGEPYNERFAQDRTGMRLESRPRDPRDVRGDPKYDIRLHARKIEKLECIGCHGEDFYIFLDGHPQGYGAAQFRCKNDRCKMVSPVFQLRVPDMVDYRAKQMGLMLPSGNVTEIRPKTLGQLIQEGDEYD